LESLEVGLFSFRQNEFILVHKACSLPILAFLKQWFFVYGKLFYKKKSTTFVVVLGFWCLPTYWGGAGRGGGGQGKLVISSMGSIK
jgi:hypothetical protein